MTDQPLCPACKGAGMIEFLFEDHPSGLRPVHGVRFCEACHGIGRAPQGAYPWPTDNEVAD